jgi:nucleoside-triphosphatase THEP1/ABC-type thiamin/hydroxymethylpyrimidine transport system permease subunit
MNKQETARTNSIIYYRLIALWVLSEAMLGGIIHGLKIPVSGLIVGSCAVLCICLIAWYVPKKGAILKATIIVAIFKMMLSPQAPPPAYVAVFFQGLMGELLFWNKRFFKLSCMVLAVLALMESGLQRILMLTIVYGNDLWKVINDFINGLTKQKTTTNYSLLIGSGYVLLHFIAGLLVGWRASILPANIARWNKEENTGRLLRPGTKVFFPPVSKNKKRLKKGLLIVWIILIALYVQSYFSIGKPILPSPVALKILVRSIIIVLSWVFIIGPLLRRLLHYWLQKRKTKSRQDIEQVLQLLPATQQLITKSWRLTAGNTGWKRIAATSKMILVNALNPLSEGNIFILSAPVQTGKTTSLVIWSQDRNDVWGILTPVVNGKRIFMDANKRQLFDMEATDGEAEVLTVGKFAFSKTSFNKAIQIIRDAMQKDGWLIIDEVGPMELKGEGFCEVVKEVIAARPENQKIVLVVREGMVDTIKEFFRLTDATVITDISNLQD